MTSQKKNDRSSSMHMDDETGPMGLQSEPAKSGKGKKKPLCSKEENRLAADIVRYLVCSNSKRVPVKRKAIVDDVIGKQNSSHFSDLMGIAKAKLEEVFGLRCEEVEHASQKCFLLVNNLDMKDYHNFVATSEFPAEMGLLFTILSIIMMAQRSVPEHELWTLLKDVQVHRDKRHSEFGDVTKLISSEFVHQLYLEVEKKLEGEKKVCYYSWGKRALLEVDRHQMLAFVAELHGSTYDSWKERYRNVLCDNTSQPLEEDLDPEQPEQMETA